MRLLECRLDNVVYRLGFSKSRSQARQFVNHDHVLVNEKKVNIPSYQVRQDDIITLDKDILDTPDLHKLLEDALYKPPAWLERKAAVGKVSHLPSPEELETNFNLQLIIEFYSR